MEDGVKTDSAEPIDGLHAQLVDEANAAANGEETQPVAGMEAQVDNPARESDNRDVDPDFVKTLVAEGLASKAKAEYEETYTALVPIAGQAQARRIAERSASHPFVQKTIADSTGRIVEKLNASETAKRFMSPWTILGGALVADFVLKFFARRDRDRILAQAKRATQAPAPAQPQAQPAVEAAK